MNGKGRSAVLEADRGTDSPNENCKRKGDGIFVLLSKSDCGMAGPENAALELTLGRA